MVSRSPGRALQNCFCKSLRRRSYSAPSSSTEASHSSSTFLLCLAHLLNCGKSGHCRAVTDVTRVRHCWRGPSLLQEEYSHTLLSLLTHPALVIMAQLEAKPVTRLSPLLLPLQCPEVPRLVATVPPYKGRGVLGHPRYSPFTQYPPITVIWGSTGSFTFHKH